MSCCENPTNLGCYDSCRKVPVTTVTGTYGPNKLYLSFNFNGAIRRILITEVDNDGKPIIDLSMFNEDYLYTFEIFKRDDNASLGCFKIKVEPCAGEFFDAPEVLPVSHYIDSTVVFGEPTCAGETTLPFLVDISDPDVVALEDGSIINMAFYAANPTAGMEIVSNDPNLVVLGPTQVQIVDIDEFTSFDLILKISDCEPNTITGQVTSFTNLADEWGNGTHTAGTKDIY